MTRGVFLDANVIIESFRVGAWPELSQGCWLETVEEVEKESLTGENSQGDRVKVDPKELRAGFRAIHVASRKERAKLVTAHSAMMSLDPGELHLFAHLYSIASPLPPLVVVSTADKGAIVRIKDLGWLDRLVSLEELLTSVGASKSKTSALGSQYRIAFLSEVRTKVYFGVIP